MALKLFGGSSNFTLEAGAWDISAKLLRVEKGHMLDM